MEIGEYLRGAEARLKKAGIGTARLDALVLLEDVTGRDRAWILANPEHRITRAEQSELNKLLRIRAGHTPLAYVRGTTEFYGRNFVITPDVLEPRPESETMLDVLGQLAAAGRLAPKTGKKGRGGPETLRVADVGAGSGALGITAQLEFPRNQKTTVDLLEIDPKAAKTAKINVEKHTTNISVIISDLLEDSPKDYDVLLCNLPYVPDGHTINRAAMQEPRIAIFGGPDGLDIYRRLFAQVKELKKRPLYILTESLPPQHDALAAIAKGAGYVIEREDDFIQAFRLN